MGFSRQEYWSGLPLPSPNINIRQLILSEVSKELFPSKQLPTEKERSAKVQRSESHIHLEMSTDFICEIVEEPDRLQSMGSQRI